MAKGDIPDGDGEIRYKAVVQVGLTTIDEDLPQSILINKVLCNRKTAVDLNKCFRCHYNQGLLNQYLIKCSKNPETEPPEAIKEDFDYDYPDKEENENGNKKRKEI